MKTITSTIAVSLLLIVSAFAQNKETRDLSTFSEVSFNISGNLYITQGGRQSVELDGEDLDEIETDLRGDKLVIKYRKSSGWNWKSRKKVDVYITMKDIEGLSVGGSGSIQGKNKFTTDDLYLSVSGSGDMVLETDSENVKISVSGSGEIDLKGSADEQRISISGSGRINAEDFVTDDVKASISGSGRCRVHANKSIDASISGSGSIYYKGSASNVNSRTSGSGRVKRI